MEFIRSGINIVKIDKIERRITECLHLGQKQPEGVSRKNMAMRARILLCCTDGIRQRVFDRHSWTRYNVQVLTIPAFRYADWPTVIVILKQHCDCGLDIRFAMSANHIDYGRFVSQIVEGITLVRH